MEALYSWLAIAVGIFGTVLAVSVNPWRKLDEQEVRCCRINAIVSLLIIVALFLLTRLTNPPFSPGGRLGYGLALGGFIGLIAGVWTIRVHRFSDMRSGVAVAVYPSMTLLGSGVTLLIFGDYPQPALVGFVIGALIPAVIFRISTHLATGMEIWAISAAAVNATVMLAIFRFGATADRYMWRAPLMILAAAIFAHILGSLASREGKSWVVPCLISSVILIGFTAAFSWRNFPEWSLLSISVGAVVTFILAAWLSSVESVSTWAAAFVILIVLAFSAGAFGLLGGFGIGIGILASLAVVLPVFTTLWRNYEEDNGTSKATQIILYAAFIALGVIFFRLFLENYAAEVRGVDLRAHYTLIALTLGALFPFLIMSLFPHPADQSSVLRRICAGALGLFAAVAPLLVLVLWGFRATIGFLMGTIVAEAFILFTALGITTTRERIGIQAAILVLVAQVTAVQFAGLLGSLAQSPRTTRLIILAGVVVVGLIWSILSSFLSNRVPKEA